MKTLVKNWQIVEVVSDGEAIGSVLWGTIIEDFTYRFSAGEYVSTSKIIRLDLEYFFIITASRSVYQLVGNGLALLLALVKDITVYEDNVEIRGGYLPLLANVANNKAGNPEGVPSLISIWR